MSRMGPITNLKVIIMNTVTKAPSIASITRKLFNTTKRTAGSVVKVLDVAVDVLDDTVDLGVKCIQSVPVCVKEVTQLPTYTKAQLMVNADETKELTHEAAIAVVRESQWKSPEDMFKSLGIVTGNTISGAIKLMNEE